MDWRVLAALVVGTVLFSLLLSHLAIFRTMELHIQDELFRLRGPLDVSDSPVVLVTISQKADDEISYKYPWPTSLYARLVRNLNKAGAKAIGIDVIFDKDDRYNPRNDSLFAAEMQRYGNVVLAGKVYRSDRKRGFTRSSEIQKVEPIRILDALNPNPFGTVTMLPDADDFVRRYLLTQHYLDQQYRVFGLEVLRVYLGKEKQAAVEDGGRLFYAGFNIPRLDDGTMRINYYGPTGTFPSVSFEEVIDDSSFTTNFEREAFEINSFTDPEIGLLKRGVFKDKLVLVGATMPELNDFHATPYNSSESKLTRGMPGVEVHANAIQTILDGNYVRAINPWGELVVLILLAFIIVTTTSSNEVVRGVALLSGLVIAYAVTAALLFVQFNFLVAWIGPGFTILTGYLATTSYEYVTEQKEKRRIKAMFQSYVAPEVVEQLIDEAEEPSLGGDEVEMTAMFTDIQSFTFFSEQLEPRKLVRLINEYLSAMTEILTDQGGTLDKYVGDAVIAFFGAPVAMPDHAYRACLTSQLMQHKLQELRNKWAAEAGTWPESVSRMRVRIGINSGLMVTGATRQEALRWGNRCIFRYLDRVVMPGRRHPVSVYEIYGLHDDLADSDRTCIEIFEEGTRLYRERRWQQALQRFYTSAELERLKPGEDPGVLTNPSLVYIERCRKMEANPPGPDWDGVHNIDAK